jgi:hypothetical protein
VSDQSTRDHVRRTAGCLALGVMVLLGPNWAARPAHAEVYGDAATKRYHTAECPEKALIKPRNLVRFTAEAEAGAKGYYPCPICITPLGQKSAPAGASRKLSQPVVRASVYLGDVAQKTYHYPWCRLVKDLPPSGIRRFTSIEKAAAEGYTRCPECNPPVAVAKQGRITAAQTPVAPPKPPTADGLPQAETQ